MEEMIRIANDDRYSDLHRELARRQIARLTSRPQVS